MPIHVFAWGFVNGRSVRLCIPLHTAIVLVVLGSVLHVNGVAAAQDNENEHAGFRHREMVGAPFRDTSAVHDSHIGTEANVTGELWLGWRGDTSMPAAPPEGTLPSATVFPGNLLDTRRGLIASWRGAALGAIRLSTGDSRFEWSTEERVRLAFDAINLDLRVGRQVPVAFNDVFWLRPSQRSVFGGGVEMPALIEVAALDMRLRMMNWGVHVYGVSLGGDFRGYDFDGGATLMTIQNVNETTLSLVRIGAVEFSGAQSSIDSTGMYTAMHAFDMQVFSLQSSHLDGWSLDFEVGMLVLSPLSTRMRATDAMNPTDDLPLPTANARFSWATEGEDFYIPSGTALEAMSAPHHGTGFSIGLATFQRIDPSGFAVDRGGMLESEARLRLADDLILNVGMSLALATRQLVRDEAPILSIQHGDVFPLVRLQATLDWSLSDHFALTATAYAERSDREDVFLLAANPDIELRSAFGANLMLTIFGDTMRHRH